MSSKQSEPYSELVNTWTSGAAVALRVREICDSLEGPLSEDSESTLGLRLAVSELKRLESLIGVAWNAWQNTGGELTDELKGHEARWKLAMKNAMESVGQAEFRLKSLKEQLLCDLTRIHRTREMLDAYAQ